MGDEAVGYELREKVAIVRLDDGKANALSSALIQAIHGALDRAEKEAGAVLLAGRPGRFSAGFDLAEMRAGPDSVRRVVGAGAELFLRFFEYPRPIVAACTGHALAAGAIALLASDVRLGAEGAFKIGLNEVAIGLTLPIFGVEFARARLSKRHFARAVVHADLYAPAEAVDAGFLDRTVAADALLDEAIAEASRLAELPAAAYAGTKRNAWSAMVAAVRETLDGDLRSFAARS